MRQERPSRWASRRCCHRRKAQAGPYGPGIGTAMSNNRSSPSIAASAKRRRRESARLCRVPQSCPFCDRIRAGDVDAVCGGAVAFADGFPASRGHTLVVPSRHEADFFALRDEERGDVWRLVHEIRDKLSASLAPDGFNVGINVGMAAGQTVFHAHVHVIPRFAGDVADPRGGVRWVLPDQAAYWQR
jgi:diadenosine tetraphosphate (Ap4A) HIT family hydrolase